MSLFLYSFEYILYDMPSFTRGYDKYFPRYNQNYSLPLCLILLVTCPNLGPHFPPGHSSFHTSITTALYLNTCSHADLSKCRPAAHKTKAKLLTEAVRLLHGLASVYDPVHFSGLSLSLYSSPWSALYNMEFH